MAAIGITAIVLWSEYYSGEEEEVKVETIEEEMELDMEDNKIVEIGINNKYGMRVVTHYSLADIEVVNTYDDQSGGVGQSGTTTASYR